MIERVMLKTDTVLTDRDQNMIDHIIKVWNDKHGWTAAKLVEIGYLAGKSAGIREARELIAGHIEEQSK